MRPGRVVGALTAAALTVTVAPAPTAQAAGSTARTAAEAAACTKFMAPLEKQMEEINKSLARVQTIKKLAVVPEDFTIDGGELTPTLKIKRKVVNQKYAEVIERLYAGA